MRQSVSCLLGSLSAFIAAMLATRYVSDIPYLSPFYSAQPHVAAAAFALAAASYGVFRNRPALVLMLAALALAIHLPVKVYRFGDLASAQEAEGKPALRVLSFNILYNNLKNGPSIRDEILQSGADVAIVLEAMPLEKQLDALAQVYPYRLGCGVETSRCDLLVLSRHPFVEKSVGDLSELRLQRYIQIAIEVGGKKVNVAAAHLSKPYFDWYHTRELWKLWRNLSQIEGPLVLAGDFNASSIAPDMMWFLDRARLTKAPFEPATWPIRLGPAGVAIDHIYARAPLRLKSLSRISDPHGSNHYGLMADLIIN